MVGGMVVSIDAQDPPVRRGGLISQIGEGLGYQFGQEEKWQCGGGGGEWHFGE